MRFIVPIHSNQSFVVQWHNWIHKQVSRHFKHGKDRIQDTVQDVIARLLHKDFIGRWFFKHLRDEFVDRGEAERMLGGVSLSTPRRNIKPFDGKCSDLDSLWRVGDVLSFAGFDFDRYYYTPQNHTIDSDRFLQLLGYPEGDYNPLKSMWRQGRIRPSEFTDHSCKPDDCSECKKGLEYLRARKVSLSSCHDWSSPESRYHAQRMRWNDSQVSPFLRNWRGMNMISTTPRHIIRLSPNRGVDAGLLSYAQKVIDNHVVNCFKRMTRWDDMSIHTFNKGVSPEFSDSESVADDGEDEDENRVRVIRDTSASKGFVEYESQHDALKVCDSDVLTDAERRVLIDVDLSDRSVKEYADSIGSRSHSINKTRNNAITKLRSFNENDSIFVQAEKNVNDKYGLSLPEVINGPKFGPHVLARREFFAELYDFGVSIDDISSIYGFDSDRISNLIAQASLAC